MDPFSFTLLKPSHKEKTKKPPQIELRFYPGFPLYITMFYAII